jgi:tetratricopeptide (TPR) repeat protein/transglutaminase-like putative cysteine protease
MNRFWVFLLCCSALPSNANTPQTADPKPASTTPQVSSTSTQKNSAPSISDYSQEPFVIEQYYTTASFENDGTGVRDLAVRIRVQSEVGVQQLGELVFGFNSANEQMDVRYARVRKSDGTVVTAGPDAVKEMTSSVERDAPVYTDYKEKHITIPGLAPGETLEYEIVTRMTSPLASGEFWFDHNFIDDGIVLDERLDMTVPAGRAVKLESPNFPYGKTAEAGHTVYRWKRANLKHLSDDDKSKEKAQRAGAKPPDVQLTTFESWKDVARWYAKLEEGRTQPSAEIRAKTQELTGGRTSSLEKIQALYDYVSRNIRYVSLSFGLGRYQPHSAAEVFSNQYGDCKDKHTLLASMLEAAGIPSDAVLIPFSRKLDTSIPSPSQFDHVITAVPEGNNLIWMDSTAEVAPFRLLTSPLRGKSALLVPPDGDGKIIETPADPPFLSTQQVEIDGQVTDLGTLTAHLHYVLRGDTEFILRSAFRKTPQTQWKELGQTILTLDGLRGDVTEVKPADPSDARDPFQLDIDFTLANFLDWSSKKAKVTLPLLTIGLPDASEDNSAPISLGSPLDVTTKLKLTFPPNFAAQAPVAIAVTRDYADFKSSYHFEDHVLTATRSLNFKMRELPADRTGDYLAFARAVSADEGQPLVVENSTTGTPTIPADAKADELLESGRAALNAGNTREAIPLLQRVVELEPKHKQAWNDLGLAFLRSGKFEEAAGAFHKQIEVNPFGENSYDYLGIALQQQQKFDEAEDAFRKQIGVNPLDTIAHAALGGLLLAQHKYADAIPELDKATVLSPDSAELQVSLGQAYLNTGEKEKALAAFEKGVELAQTPIVWNNVAYALADHKLDLERAQQYAESAVSATAANLRNIELAHLKLANLNDVNSIGAYWDTLGWVYFQKGDLPAASKFINAAWRLNQHGEVADHLARVSEAQGHKDQAIHLYAMAIAAPYSVPETRARLTLLLGGNATIDDLVAKAKPELPVLRSIPAGKLIAENASADFLILVSPQGTDGSATKVDAVRFVSGNEKLRPFAENLRRLDYGTMFPDASPVKLVRRGTLSCSATSDDCAFKLIIPENVRAVN